MTPLALCTRRSALSALVVAATLAFGAGVSRADPRPRLFVFVPVMIRTRALQVALAEGLPGVAVTVYGRFTDFEIAVEELDPEAALAPAASLHAAGVEPVLSGTYRGVSHETQLVVSKRPVSRQALHGRTIGAVDIVGRHRLPQLVADLLDLSQPPPIRRVVKVSDLLPLLQLDLADAVLLPERFLDDFRQMSEIDFKILRLDSARLDRVAIGFPMRGGETRIETAVRRMPGRAKSILGVEGWR